MQTLASLCDEFFALSLEAEPFAATILGFHDYDAAVPDVSVEGEADMRARLARVQRQAAELAGTLPPGQDEVSRAMLFTMAGHAIENIDARGIEFTVTPFWFGAQAQVLTWLPKTQIESREQAGAYLERCAGLPGFLADSTARLRRGLHDKLTPVAAGVSGSISQIDEYLALDAAEDPLLQPLRDAVARGTAGAETLERGRDIVRGSVHSAMADFRAVLADEIAPRARTDEQPGLSWLPGGDERYAAAIRQHTTTDRDARELHQLGLEQIARLEDEYRELGARVLGTDDLAEIYARLRDDPALRFSDADAVLSSAREAIARAQAALPDWFGLLPQRDCEVRAIPEMEARGSTIAYYTPPPEDGGSGVYWVNTTTAASVYEAEAVAFHEALPGHHLQIDLAQRLHGLPDFRRYAGVTAYTEGWGLYTERLADEMGLYSSDLTRIGMLSLDSLRAGRLVVDTGLHALGWSRRQAVDFLVDNSPQQRDVMDSEVERYISYPGQALGYMVGRIELNRMREAARARMGARFDMRGFHDVVLGSGAVPLNVLDDMVRAWADAPG